MTENYVRLTDDTSNTGKYVRTNQRLISGINTEEHFTILQDYENNYQAKIDSDGKLNIAGSISSLPNITVNSASTIGSYSYQNTIISGAPIVKTGSEQWIQNTVEVSGNVFKDVLGSVFVSNQISEVTVGSESYIKNWNELGSSRVVTNLYAGSKVWQGDRFGVSGNVTIENTSIQTLLGSTSIYNKVAGSIVNMPTVTVTSTNLDIRDLTAASDSIITLLGSTSIYNRVAGSIVNIPGIDINNPATIGSYTTQNIVGSIAITNSINVVTGSESYIKAGSVELYNLGSNAWVYLNSGTSYINVTQTTNPWIVLGSVYQTNSTPTTLTGSMEVFSSTGSVEIYGALSATAGSEQWIQNVVEVSGAKLNDLAGSFAISNFDAIGSTVLIDNFNVLGSSVVVTNFNDLGSSTVITNFNDLGSSVVVTNFGDLGSTVLVDNFGDIGSSRIITAGSVIITNNLTNADLGSPSYYRGILSASGTYTNVWRAPATGSRIEIHGYHISTNAPGYVRLCQSGTTPIVISDWNMNYASGAQIEKTFSTPIVPSAANLPIGIGATVAGSTLCTIYGREVK